MGNFEGGQESDHCPSLAWSSHSERDEAITIHYIQVEHNIILKLLRVDLPDSNN